MSLITLQEALDFLEISVGYFTITSGNNTLKMTYDSGSLKTVTLSDGTYSGDGLATAIQTAMNTALTMSGTVTYSSTTKMFTFGAGAGHTLAYTHSGSDAGFTVGFDEDHAAALTLTSDLAAGDPTAMVTVIKDATEAWIQTVYCRRNLISTSYKEKYDGTGCNSLVLDNYPIIALNRLSMGFDEAMRVKNSSTFGHASVSVSSTGVTLYKDGTSSTILFTASATMSAMATAISAVSGWSATVSVSSYNSYPSNLLSEKMGLQCVNNAEASLMMPADGEWDFEVDSTKGIIYSVFGFLEGTRNIFVDYSAGYATIPDDLKLATMILIKNIYQRRSEESWGMTNYSISGISVSFDKDIPMEAKQILNHYKRTLI